VSTFTKATASSLGAILDCDLATGNQIVNGVVTTNPATDNTAILNAFLAQGTATNHVVLEMDGASSVSGLFLPTLGHASIIGQGWDTGFWVKSGSNQDCIHNGNATASIPFDPGGGPPAINGANVELRNFRINGNRGNGTTGNSNSGNPKGNMASTVWYMGISLISIAHFRIEDVWLYDIATYAVRLSNCTDGVIQGLRVDVPSLAFNTDGVHLSGQNSDIRISKCYFQTGDDAIALNAPEGYGGNIARVAISNIVYNQCTTGLRAYVGVGTTYTISKVVMDNCTGTFTLNGLSYTFAVLLGNSGPGTRGVDQIQDFTISNCTFTLSGNAPIAIADSCGTVNIQNVTWKDPFLGTTTGFVTFVGQCNVSSLNITNCKTYRSTLGNSATLGLNNSGQNGAGSSLFACTIGKLTFSGFNVDNETGTAYAAIADLINMTSLTIGELVIDAVDSTLITAITNTFTGITTIRGVGLSQTGWQIPDANVAANVLYISATSPNAGKLCIQHTLGTVVTLG
jgi:hypothetical protein